MMLRPALNEYLKAIPQFSGTNVESAVKNLKRARTEFAKSLERARAIEIKLDQIEATTTAGDRIYRSPRPLIEFSTKEPDPVSQKIEAALDQ